MKSKPAFHALLGTLIFIIFVAHSSVELATAKGSEEAHGSVKCPYGYKPSGKMCLLEKEVEKKPYCKHGKYDEESEMCVTEYRGHKECSKGYHLSHDHKLCKKEVTECAKPYCHGDFELHHEKVCKRVTQAEPECPNGEKPDEDGNCTVEKPSEVDCPPDSIPHYHKKSDKLTCTVVDVKNPIDKCTKGYTPCEKSGTCKLEKTLEKICPPQSMENKKGKCAIYKHPEEVCPDHYKLVTRHGSHGHARSVEGMSQEHYHTASSAYSPVRFLHELQESKCVKKEVVDPLPKCKDGFLLSKNKQKCIKIKVLDRECPGGSSVVLGKCEVREPAIEKCLGEVDDGECIKREIYKGQVICPNDKKLDICTKTIIHDPKCPDGYKESRDGDDCVKFSPIKHLCKDGYKLVENDKGYKCLKIIKKVAKPNCKYGRLTKGKHGLFCEVEKTCPAIEFCPHGVKDGYGKCVISHPVDHEYTCPDDYHPANHPRKCEKHIAEICDKPYYETQCRDIKPCVGSKGECDGNGGGNAGSDDGGDDGDSGSDVGSSYFSLRKLRANKSHGKYHGPNKICEEVRLIKSVPCKKTVYAQAIPTCPDGARTGKESCVKDKKFPVKHNCPEGEYDPNLNLCVVQKKKPVEFMCPDNFKMFHEHGDYFHSHPFSNIHHHHKKFSKRHNHDDVSKVMCVKKVKKESFTKCKEGNPTKNENKCVLRAKKVCEVPLCKEVIKEDHTLDCGKGEATGKPFQCEKISPGPVKHLCVLGVLDLKTKECVTAVPKECPNGGNCKKVITVDPYPTCKKDFKLIASTGSHEHSDDGDDFYYHVHSHQNHRKGEKSHKKGSGGNSEDGHFHGGPKCVGKDVRRPTLDCKKGKLIKGKCVKFVNKVCPGGDCEVTLYKKSVQHCPPGYKEKLGLKKKHGMKCVAHLPVDPKYSCPKGGDLSSDLKTCEKTFPAKCRNDGCEKKDFKKPHYKCPKNMQLDYRHMKKKHSSKDDCVECVGYDKEKAVVSCDKAKVSKWGDYCVKETSPNYKCPHKAEEIGHKCVITKYVKPSYTSHKGKVE